MSILESTGNIAKKTLKLPFILLRGLFGRDLLGRDVVEQTSYRLTRIKYLLSQFKGQPVEHKEEKLPHNINKEDFQKKFSSLRLTNSIVLLMLVWTLTRFFEATHLEDFLAQLSFAALLAFFYLSMSRYMYKARIIYQALPGELSEDDQIVTWSKYFTAVAESPSLLIPKRL